MPGMNVEIASQFVGFIGSLANVWPFRIEEKPEAEEAAPAPVRRPIPVVLQHRPA